MTATRVGRNDPCVCGSGLKYKKCCIGRDPSGKLSDPNQGFQVLRSLAKKGPCSHPEAPQSCRGAVVRAHTIPRASVLARLAVDGHVFGYKADQRQMVEGVLEPRIIGIREASAFSGFCGYHDNLLFSRIDDAAGLQLDEESMFLLTYRASIREWYFKRIQAQHAKHWLAPLLRSQGGPRILAQYVEGVNAGVRDMEAVKVALDDVLLRREFHRVRYCTLIFSGRAEFATANSVQPEVCFSGDYIREPGSLRSVDNAPRPITQTVFPTGDNEVACVFSWVDPNPASDHLVKSLLALPEASLPSAVVRYAFEFSENIFFSQVWWTSLPARTRAALIARINEAVDLERPRARSSLSDDGHQLIAWETKSRGLRVG